MTDLALGWTDAEARLPNPLRLLGNSPVRLIAAPVAQADTPRQRLTLQQACFDAGIDLVPLAADQRITADPASKPPPGLLTQLRGCGQLSLTLTWTVPLQTTLQATGPTWLRMRRRHLAEAAALRLMAEQTLLWLVDGLPYRQSSRRLTDHCSLDLLVPRKELSVTQEKLARRGQTLSIAALPGAALLVTGLWPPFRFVEATQGPEVPA